MAAARYREKFPSWNAAALESDQEDPSTNRSDSTPSQDSTKDQGKEEENAGGTDRGTDRDDKLQLKDNSIARHIARCSSAEADRVAASSESLKRQSDLGKLESVTYDPEAKN